MSARLNPGTTLGAFEIVDFVAAGGMGSVYKARNRISGEIRALKVVLPELASNREFVARFIREIRIAASIEHPNLVRVLEPAMDGDTVFLPMELLEGEPLSAFARRAGRLTVPQTLAIVLPVCDAISAVHARGIIHRDLKPANIFLARSATGIAIPKVLDFGAAREVDPTDENTRAGTVIGSPHYMAYEQAAGQRDLDGRVDQYALAVIVYQLLTGTRPYENDDTGHVLAKVLQGAVYPPPREIVPGIPVALDAAILRAMSRRRDERFASVMDFAEALAPFAKDDDATIMKPAAPEITSARVAEPVVKMAAPRNAQKPLPLVDADRAPRLDPSPAGPDPLAEKLAASAATPRWVALVVALSTLLVVAMIGWKLLQGASSSPPLERATYDAGTTSVRSAVTTDAHVPSPQPPVVPLGPVPAITPLPTSPAELQPIDAGRAPARSGGGSHIVRSRCIPRPGVPCL